VFWLNCISVSTKTQRDGSCQVKTYPGNEYAWFQNALTLANNLSWKWLSHDLKKDHETDDDWEQLTEGVLKIDNTVKGKSQVARKVIVFKPAVLIYDIITTVTKKRI
jgi:hypothetical protein